MHLEGYPPDYVPEVTQVHPQLRDGYAALLEVASKPRGVLQESPIWPLMIFHNLAFLGGRDIVLAHNLKKGVQQAVDFMHTEVGEVLVETPLKNSNMLWSRVDGRASQEGVDVEFFLALGLGLHEAGLSTMSDPDLLSIFGTLRLFEQIRTSSRGRFDPTDRSAIKRVVHPTTGKNWKNYPGGVLGAPRTFDIDRMAVHHTDVMLPKLKSLRHVFELDGRKIPSPVAEALNRGDQNPPLEYMRRSGFEGAYLAVIENSLTRDW